MSTDMPSNPVNVAPTGRLVNSHASSKRTGSARPSPAKARP